jgi:hypothetical protein
MNSHPVETTPRITSRSRAKIWIRTGLLVVFGGLFGVSLARDIQSGTYPLALGLAILLVCLATGFWMRRLVPMRVHLPTRSVVLSFDRVYFILIWVLVIGKAISSYLLHLNLPADILMCTILGLMAGRLSGICLRVRSLKVQYGFLQKQAAA